MKILDTGDFKDQEQSCVGMTLKCGGCKALLQIELGDAVEVYAEKQSTGGEAYFGVEIRCLMCGYPARGVKWIMKLP